MDKLNHTKHSPKMIWGCIASAILAIFLLIDGVGTNAFVTILCVLIVAAMMWMMMSCTGPYGEERR
jgi:hypothetical protein